MTRQLGFMCIRYAGTYCAVQHLPWQRCAVPLWRHNIQYSTSQCSCRNCIKHSTPQLGQAAVARPWDAARSLVWPSAPPGRADVLAHGTVAAGGPKITMDLGFGFEEKVSACPSGISILYACIGVLIAEYRLPNAQCLQYLKRSGTCRAFS